MRAAAVIWFVLSSGGLLLWMLLFAVWFALAPRSRKARVGFVLVVAAYTLLSIYPLTRGVTRLIGRGFGQLTKADVPDGRTAVVLLGSGSYTLRDWTGAEVSVPDVIGTERALEAARVFKLLDAACVVSSGGRIGPEDRDEPAGLSMKNTLVWLGVPSDRIVVENESRNTHDEAVIIKSMLPRLKVDHVVIVTSVVHMRRSLAVFRQEGIPAIPAITFESHEPEQWLVRWFPTHEGLREGAMAVHELAGFAYYKARGWL